MTETVLITGATGNTGSAIVELLASRDVAVRIMTRDPSQVARWPDAEVVVADFDDATALAGALDGVDRAYLVTPSTERAEEQQLRFAEIAAKSGVGHLVKLSQLAAHESSPVRFLRYHAAVERRIRELGGQYTFLRPNLFFQGLLGLAEPIRTQGKLFAPIGEARISLVDVRDIAAVAAAALTETGHAGKSYTITGPTAITHAQVAAALSTATGRDISFVDAPAEVFADALRDIMPPWQVDGLIEDYAHYSRGEAAEVSPAVADVTGQPPRNVTIFAHDYAHAFTPPNDDTPTPR